MFVSTELPHNQAKPILIRNSTGDTLFIEYTIEILCDIGVYDLMFYSSCCSIRWLVCGIRMYGFIIEVPVPP